MKLLVLGVCLCVGLASFGARTSCDLATGWQSTCTPEGTNATVLTLASVTIPHNWGDYWGLRQRGHGNLHGTAVYRRTFACRPEKGRHAYLVFEGVGMYLGVTVNGREICRHRPAGKVVTTLDVTEALDASGKNELVVTCEHPSDIVDLPWVCGACSAAHCEGPEPTGLCRMVRLVTTDEVRIAPFGVFIWGKEPFDAVTVETEVTNAGGCPAERQVRVRCPAVGIDGMAAVSLSAGETKTVKLTLPMKGVRRWSAEEPNLYRFDVTLEKEGVVSDADSVETGFRTVSWPFRRKTADRRFFVNGKPVFLHGVCETDHRFGGSLCFEPEEIDARAKLVKETLGFNAVRDGHEPHDLRWGRNWDRLGVYWWPQFGTHNYYENEAFRRNYRMLFRQWMKERRNSPSVVLWGLQNESVLDVDFCKELTAFVHANDPASSLTDRLTTCCNYGEGADWTVVQNWSGTYGGDIEKYGEELSTDAQLLNGEYGAWRHLGLHETLPPAFDPNGRWSEEHAAYILHRKMVLAWKSRDRLCGHFQWILFTHENPGRRGAVDDGVRLIDKGGPVNNKGILTLWGAPTAAYYVYRVYGDALRKGTLDEIADWPLDKMIACGKELEAPRPSAPVSLAGETGRTYLYRLNCGGDAVVDASGNAWLPDSTFFTKSWTMADEFVADKLNPVLCSQGDIAEGVANAATADQLVLSSYRWGRGNLSFTFAVAPSSSYRLEAWFVEPGGYGRIFDVAVNGRVVEKDLNLPQVAGNRVAMKRSWDVRSDEQGRLVVTFPRVAVSQAVVSALAISADAATAAKCPPVVRPGYPETASLTWKALCAQTVDRVPQDKLPAYKNASRVPVQPIVPPTWRRQSTFLLPLSNQYTLRFKVKACDRARKNLWWELVATAGKRLIAEDALSVCPEQVGQVVEVPVDTFVNAGAYQVTVSCPEGTTVEPIEMFETKGKGQ